MAPHGMDRRAVFIEWSGQPVGRWSLSRLPTPPWERASKERARARGSASASDVFLSALLPDEESQEDFLGEEDFQKAATAAAPAPAATPAAPGRRASAPPSPTDFEYVVREQQKTRVAFGCAQDRAVLPLAGPGGGASRLANLSVRATDQLHHLGPALYSVPNLEAFYKVTSTCGFGPAARTAPRFKETDLHLPAPNAYSPHEHGACCSCCRARSAAPFNSTSRRRPGPAGTASDTPGPGTYTPEALRGPGVPVVVRCGGGEGPRRCEDCDTDLPPGVEFWAPEHSPKVVCQDCMTAARKARKYRDTYKKTRDCSDIHRHEGTTAKIYLIDPATVERRRRREAYLAKYFRDQRVGADKDFMAGTEPARLEETASPQTSAGTKDEYCCLHEAFNSFNKGRMSFGVPEPHQDIHNTLKRCALDRQPSPFSPIRRGSVQQ